MKTCPSAGLVYQLATHTLKSFVRHKTLIHSLDGCEVSFTCSLCMCEARECLFVERVELSLEGFMIYGVFILHNRLTLRLNWLCSEAVGAA